MKIDIAQDRITIDNVDQGEGFIYNSEYYISTDLETNTEIRATNLATGDCISIDVGSFVEPIDLVVVKA